MPSDEPIPADLTWRMYLADLFDPGPDPDAEVKIRNIDTGGDDAE